MTLISAALLGVTLLASAQSPDQRAEAERMANSGANAAALKQFQAIAAANPDDLEARLWIARLHTRMGHPEHAADVYRSILAARPQNFEALVGLGNALLVLGRLKEAGDALNRAEALGADRPDVLTAQGKLHQAANHTTLALAYFLRAIALDPTNADARRAADRLRAARGHRIHLGYDFQHMNTEVEDAHVGTFEVNARVADNFRVFARGQAERAFGLDEQRVGGGIEWLATRHASVRAGGMGGIDTTYLPTSEGFVEASVASGRARWSVQVRKESFDGIEMWIGGPGVTMTSRNGVEASAHYYRGHVATTFFEATTTDTVALGLAGHPSDRVRVGVGYTHGIDRLDWLTVDRIAFESDTLSFRASYDFNPFATFEAGYDYQSRPGPVQAHRARAGFIYRF
jgi:tetratricopeptide (TPR) repeat protein